MYMYIIHVYVYSGLTLRRRLAVPGPVRAGRVDRSSCRVDGLKPASTCL